MNLLYPQIVKERAEAVSSPQAQLFSAMKMASVFRTVIFSDVFLKDFYGDAETCDDLEIKSDFWRFSERFKGYALR